MSAQPEISFIIPVYNKADILPFTLDALMAQRFEGTAEYIFVDDASSDGSRTVLEQHRGRLPAMIVITNDKNAGPSVRINQGANKASGRLFCLIDADELIAPDAISVMRHLLIDRTAQMIHGKVVHCDLPPANITPALVGATPAFEVSDEPLRMVLGTRGLVRMTWLVEAKLFREAGGCDERLFIQDEALPLRLAVKARRMIDLQAGMVFAPRAASHLSAQKGQQHHDRFFAFYHALRDNPHLEPEIRRLLARNCISSAWKAVRHGSLSRKRAEVALTYICMKAGLLDLPEAAAERLSSAVARMSGIRHPDAAAQDDGSFPA